MERLTRKHLLLDTNLIINIAKYGDVFLPFLDQLVESSVKSVIDYAIKFEFLRSSNTKEDLQKKSQYLDALLGADRLELMTDKEIFEKATEIGNIYSRRNSTYNKQISFGDCLIAAQMMKYNDHHETLFLATSDNKDFPLCIFDRIDIFTVDTKEKGEIINIGIYSFSKSKYQVLKREFLS